MRIAITTPTGQVGSKVVEWLLMRGGHDLVLLTRNSEKLSSLRNMGARIIEGDLTDQHYVVDATVGVNSLFFVIPPAMRGGVEDDRQFARDLAANISQAASANHISNIIFQSSVGTHLEHGTGLISSLHDAEVTLSQAADHLTVLRPGFFMENYLGSLDTIRQQGAVYLPVSAEARVPMVATRDIAANAAEALTEPSPPPRQIVPLLGPRDYSFGEAAQTIGRAIGREVHHIRVTGEQAREHLIQRGASPSVADRMVAMFDALDRGLMLGEHAANRQTVTPTTLEQFAKEVLAPKLQAVTT
jgi:uncharacterized protein YbjT (DUF2867 family)